MNYRDLVEVLESQVQRPDMSNHYNKWINRALRTIQQEVSWNCMKKRLDFTIPSGSTSVDLNADFKELTPEDTPVHVKGTESPAQFFPCEVKTFEQLTRSQAYLLYPYTENTSEAHRWGVPVYLDINDQSQTWSLNVIAPADGALTFRVAHFAFMPKLLQDADSNFLTREYEEMVEHKLKATAFAALNDPISGDFEALYRDRRRLAEADNERRRFQGRRLRMGGG